MFTYLIDERLSFGAAKSPEIFITLLRPSEKSWREKVINHFVEIKKKVYSLLQYNCEVMDALKHVFWCSSVFNFRLRAVYFKKWNLTAKLTKQIESTSRENYTEYFKLCLYILKSKWTGMLLSIQVKLFLRLQRRYIGHTETYLDIFCRRMGYSPVPASSLTLCRYASLVARKIFN